MNNKDLKKQFKDIFLCGSEKLTHKQKEELWNYIRYLMDKDKADPMKQKCVHGAACFSEHKDAQKKY